MHTELLSILSILKGTAIGTIFAVAVIALLKQSYKLSLKKNVELIFDGIEKESKLSK